MIEYAIRAEDLSKAYFDGELALDAFSATFEMGAFVALVGPNGAGKTTLINLICGAILPTHGSVEIHEDVLNGRPVAQAIGWSSQRPTMDWFLSVKDNILLGARFGGLGRKESFQAVRRAATLVGLEEQIDRLPETLSGGEQQRVQIARAIAHSPNMYILDELTVGLDPTGTDSLFQFLYERTRDGAFVMVSSHDLGALEKYCDIVVLLLDGHLVDLLAKDEFLRKYAQQEVLIVDHAGVIPEVTFGEIESRFRCSITRHRPLEITIDRGQEVGALTSFLEQYVQLRDIRRTTPGLRDAFLSASASFRRQ